MQDHEAEARQVGGLIIRTGSLRTIGILEQGFEGSYTIVLLNKPREHYQPIFKLPETRWKQQTGGSRETMMSRPKTTSDARQTMNPRPFTGLMFLITPV